MEKDYIKQTLTLIPLYRTPKAFTEIYILFSPKICLLLNFYCRRKKSVDK